MRIEPVEEPRGLFNRIVYWMSRRQFGKVPSVVRVAYARSRPFAMLGYRIRQFTEKGTRLEPGLGLMIQVAVADAIECGFCMDIGRAIALQKKLGLEKFDALADWSTSPLFSDRERVAIAYARSVAADCHVSDEVFEGLREHFDDDEIIDVVAVAAIERFYNGIAIPLGLEGDGLCVLGQRGPSTKAA